MEYKVSQHCYLFRPRVLFWNHFMVSLWIIPFESSHGNHYDRQTHSHSWTIYRTIRHVKHYLDTDMRTKAVMSMVIQRLDYCNSLLCGVPQSSLRKLQLAHNRAARLISDTRRRDHITPVLKQLHWLPVASRVDFKSLVLVFEALNSDHSPQYMKVMFTATQSSSRFIGRIIRIVIRPSAPTRQNIGIVFHWLLDILVN